MKKFLSLLIIAGAVVGSLLAVDSASAVVCAGYQGCTGIGTASSTAVGQYLQVASTSPFLTYQYANPTGATTTINGVQGPTFTFTIIGTSSQSTITTTTAQLFLNLLAYSSGTDINVGSNGVINFVNTSGFITTSSISIGGIASGTFQTGTGIAVSATGTIYIAAPLPSIATTSKTIYDYAPSSTDDIPFNIDMPATTTLQRVECINDNASGNTFTFNIVWGGTRTSASSSAFTSGQTCTNIATTTVLTPNGSTTIGVGAIVRLVMSAASSTGATVQIEY
jgi:hypothetical protein